MNFKTVAVLTSGGDAPGMNAAVRSIVRLAITKGIRVLGVRRGYSGLINKDIFEMSIRTVSEIIERGGTILYTTRSPEFHTDKGVQKAIKNCRELNIDAVIVLGGEGSINGTKKLIENNINCICIPCTIDNDVACSENSIGFDTAVNTAMSMIDKIRDTAQAHDRCSVVEVMGKKCGNIALQTGIAVGATAILIPEYSFDFNRDIVEKIDFTQKMGKKHFIIIVAEGLKITSQITAKITEKTGIESRATILGYVQRGGSPTAADRVLASKMGCYAVELIENNIYNKVIAIKNNKIININISEALNYKSHFDIDTYKKALEISI
ncbi:MAG: 6-phosphofructokinase [Clostridia bacterium]|nr:6-phosphofructokinase [Clostridia bacterium]